jgi:uncharacterized protein YheU (UPF0270 family)
LKAAPGAQPGGAARRDRRSTSRAGTDYGASEKSIEEKIADVQRQLERGEAVIVFDVDAATTNIVATHEAGSRV